MSVLLPQGVAAIARDSLNTVVPLKIIKLVKKNSLTKNNCRIYQINKCKQKLTKIFK